MRRVSMKVILASALSALLAGCATTVEMGPGYYRYDSRTAYRPATAVVYQEPTVMYREPTVVYRQSAVVYHEPAVVYRSGRAAAFSNATAFSNDHGQ